MTTETLELLLLALAGNALHYVSSWKSLVEQNRIKEFNVINEVPGFILSILTSIIMVYVREDIKAFFVVTPFGAVMLGYFGQSLFKKLIDAKSPIKEPKNDNNGKVN